MAHATPIPLAFAVLAPVVGAVLALGVFTLGFLLSFGRPKSGATTKDKYE